MHRSMAFPAGLAIALASCAPAPPPTPVPTFNLCSMGAYIKPHPKRIIEIEVAAKMGDLYNTFVRTMVGNCIEQNPDEYYVCGTAVKRNQAGYISDPTLFFGEYRGSNFLVTGIGAKAGPLCDRHVLKSRTPQT